MWTKIYNPNSDNWEVGWYFFRHSEHRTPEHMWLPFYWDGYGPIEFHQPSYRLVNDMKNGVGEVAKIADIT